MPFHNLATKEFSYTYVERFERSDKALYLGTILPTFGTGQADLEIVVFHQLGARRKSEMHTILVD